jgi:hypothetical protein
MADSPTRALVQERDRVAAAPVYGGWIFLVVLLLACAFLTWQTGRRLARVDRAPGPAAVRPEQALINQSLFVTPESPTESDADEQHALASYGWVNRDQQVAQIPVDRAIAALVEQGHVR